jgi:hypothetical protein
MKTYRNPLQTLNRFQIPVVEVPLAIHLCHIAATSESSFGDRGAVERCNLACEESASTFKYQMIFKSGRVWERDVRERVIDHQPQTEFPNAG